MTMLEYHVAYYRIEDGWYMAKVLDFPGAVTQGRTLHSARRMIKDSLQGLAEFIIKKGEPLPQPNRQAKDKKAAYQEKLVLRVYSEMEDPTDEKAKTTKAPSAARVRL
jgi:predicted RNase H-like HicB family nuclease